MTASPALRDLLQRMSADQRTVFAVGGLLASGRSDVEIAKAVGVELALVRGFRLLIARRAGRPEVLDALLPEREREPRRAGGSARTEAGA